MNEMASWFSKVPGLEKADTYACLEGGGGRTWAGGYKEGTKGKVDESKVIGPII
jgi:hypothetical protein